MGSLETILDPTEPFNSAGLILVTSWCTGYRVQATESLYIPPFVTPDVKTVMSAATATWLDKASASPAARTPCKKFRFVGLLIRSPHLFRRLRLICATLTLVDPKSIEMSIVGDDKDLTQCHDWFAEMNPVGDDLLA